MMGHGAADALVILGVALYAGGLTYLALRDTSTAIAAAVITAALSLTALAILGD